MNITVNLTKSELENAVIDYIRKKSPGINVSSVSFNIGTSGEYRDSYSVVTGATAVADMVTPTRSIVAGDSNDPYIR